MSCPTSSFGFGNPIGFLPPLRKDDLTPSLIPSLASSIPNSFAIGSAGLRDFTIFFGLRALPTDFNAFPMLKPPTRRGLPAGITTPPSQ